MRRILFLAIALLVSITATAQSKVYVTRNISPESLVRIYKALGVPAKGRMAPTPSSMPRRLVLAAAITH